MGRKISLRHPSTTSAIGAHDGQETGGYGKASQSPSNTPHSSGAVGGLSVDGEEAPTPEDVTKWTVDDVCSFVGGLFGCGEYTRVRGAPVPGAGLELTGSHYLPGKDGGVGPFPNALSLPKSSAQQGLDCAPHLFFFCQVFSA